MSADSSLPCHPLPGAAGWWPCLPPWFPREFPWHKGTPTSPDVCLQAWAVVRGWVLCPPLYPLSLLPRTPLHAAAFADNIHGLQLLLRHQAEVDMTDKLGRTPLMMASENGHTAAVGTWLAAAFPGMGCESPSASFVTGSHGAVSLSSEARRDSCPCPLSPQRVAAAPQCRALCRCFSTAAVPSSFQSSCCTKQKQI